MTRTSLLLALLAAACAEERLRQVEACYHDDQVSDGGVEAGTGLDPNVVCAPKEKVAERLLDSSGCGIEEIVSVDEGPVLGESDGVSCCYLVTERRTDFVCIPP